MPDLLEHGHGFGVVLLKLLAIEREHIVFAEERFAGFGEEFMRVGHGIRFDVGGDLTLPVFTRNFVIGFIGYRALEAGLDVRLIGPEDAVVVAVGELVQGQHRHP